MWIFTRYGFYSVVCARGKDGAGLDTNTLMVRARVRHHLERLQSRFGSLESYSIHASANTDYRYRIIVPKTYWKEVATQMAEEISYGNFKDEATKTLGFARSDYIEALHYVWSRLYGLQTEEQ
jgi:hypothetical protein